jgi:hypothetical protein
MRKRFWYGGLAAVLTLCALPLFAQKAEQKIRDELELTLQRRYVLTEVGPTWLGFRGEESDIKVSGIIIRLLRGELSGAFDKNQSAYTIIRDDVPEFFRGNNDTTFSAGERFHVHALGVGSDVVTFGLVTARVVNTDSGNGRLWTSVSFIFPKKVIQQGEVQTIFRVLDTWFLPEGQTSFYAKAPTSAPAPIPVPASTSAPVQHVTTRAELSVGASRADVEAKLGTAQREITFGETTWLHYSGLVVELKNDRVISIQTAAQTPAQVKIESEPQGAQITLDGNFVGTTPSKFELPPGNYTITFQKVGYKELEKKLLVLGGSEISFKVDLEKQPAETE